MAAERWRNAWSVRPVSTRLAPADADIAAEVSFRDLGAFLASQAQCRVFDNGRPLP